MFRLNARRLYRLIMLVITVLFLGAGIRTAQAAPDVVPDPAQPRIEISGTAYIDLAKGIEVRTGPELQLIEDQFLSRCFGVTVKEHDSEHWLHVGRCLDLKKGDDEAEISSLRSTYASLLLSIYEERIGGHKALIVDGAPGPQETSYGYVTVGEHIFEIVFSGGQLLEEGLDLVERVSFFEPSAPLPKLPTADEALRPHLPPEKEVREMWPQKALWDEEIMQLRDRPILQHRAPLGQGDLLSTQTMSGCVAWPSWKGPRLQTPIGPDANGMGWSWAGSSFHGEGLHQGCNDPRRLNDYYAIDFPLRTWDSVLSVIWGPDAGTVIWTGWADGGWSELGRCVIVDLYDTFISSFCHLQGIAVWPGQRVTGSTILGWAGGSGNWNDRYWGSHLHTDIHHKANLDRARGGIYGGYSTMPVWIRTFMPDTRYFSNGFYAAFQWRQWVSW